MRTGIAVIVLMLAPALLACICHSYRSDNEIAPKVRALLIAVLPPVLADFVIIMARVEWLSAVARYVYMLGMNVAIYTLLDFAMAYCRLPWSRRWKTIVAGLLIADAVQLLLNPVFGHAFYLEEVTAYGAPYFLIVSKIGRSLHLVLDYSVWVVVLIIFLAKMKRASRIYSERYSIMILTLVFSGLWESFYIISLTPINRSVTAYGVFGLLVYYFSLHYRPLRLLDHLLANVASGLTDALFFFDDGGKCVWADDKGIGMVKLPDGRFERCVELLDAMFPGLDFSGDEWSVQKTLSDSGGIRYYRLTKRTVLDARGRVEGSFIIVQDETGLQLELEEERYLLNHDKMTGLLTKDRLYELIRRQIDNHPDEVYYISYMDIDNFKLINNIYGRDFGDYALKSLASSLMENLPGGTLCGRIGGDSFGFCFPDMLFDREKAERLMSSFTVERGATSYRMIIHQGVYAVTDRALDVSTMFDRAHIALNTIKGDFKRHVVLFDSRMLEQALWDQDISTQLQEALAQKQIRPYLQAIVNAEGEMIGAEALVRWVHPEHGFLSPAQFIPALEDSGLIADVDRYMWRCACETLARWKAMGREDLFVSVNVSPKDFYFMDVIEELENAVRLYRVDPSRLRVEITETTMMTDSENRIRMLEKLQGEGFLLEMDDFGSGYSSLNLLKDLPVDIIKIDMAFLKETRDRARASAILSSIISMSNKLGILPLTEGVETESRYRMLSEMGCKLFQGYYFAKPMPIDEFERRFSIAP